MSGQSPEPATPQAVVTDITAHNGGAALIYQISDIRFRLIWRAEERGERGDSQRGKGIKQKIINYLVDNCVSRGYCWGCRDDSMAFNPSLE